MTTSETECRFSLSSFLLGGALGALGAILWLRNKKRLLTDVLKIFANLPARAKDSPMFVASGPVAVVINPILSTATWSMSTPWTAPAFPIVPPIIVLNGFNVPDRLVLLSLPWSMLMTATSGQFTVANDGTTITVTALNGATFQRSGDGRTLTFVPAVPHPPSQQLLSARVTMGGNGQTYTTQDPSSVAIGIW